MDKEISENEPRSKKFKMEKGKFPLMPNNRERKVLGRYYS